MEIIRLSESGMDNTVVRLRELLDSAEIIAYPTETFYGLGVKYDQGEALERLYHIKQRPLDKAMPLIIGRTGLLTLVTHAISSAAERLMEKFWPGPLTLIFEACGNLSPYITAGTGKVAVRVPGKSFALDLARHLDYPITATSANITGMPPAETADRITDYFGNSICAVVDDGKTPGQIPSTIVDVTGPEIRIMRQGIIPQKEITAAVYQ